MDGGNNTGQAIKTMSVKQLGANRGTQMSAKIDGFSAIASPGIQRDSASRRKPTEADFRPAQHGKGLPLAERLSVAAVRRQELKGMLRRGLSNKAMADELGISKPLVEYHLRVIYAEAGVTNSREWLAMQT